MLSADLVRPSSSGGVLRVRPLVGAKRERALELASLLLEEARAHLGGTRDEVQDALTLEVPAKERKLYLGIKKLLEDRCAFEEETAHDPIALRQEVFTRAATRRLALERSSDDTVANEAVHDAAALRAAVLDEVARERGLSASELEAALFTDLKGAHRLLSVDVVAAAEIVDRYDLAQAQALLLRASRVVAQVGGSDPDGYRALFRRLKFLRLLYRIDLEDDGYRLEIDGPASLFSAATRYGLDLALALPALAALPRCSLEADVLWGKKRVARRFVWTPADAHLPSSEEPAPRRDEVTRLHEALEKLGGPWRARPSTDVLHLPGAGVCVPDLTFVHESSGDVVHLEVLGFWSREAVWRRVELVESGLVDRVVFAVSQRLRVSERALDDDAPAALYAFKGVMSARAVLQKIEAVSRR